MQVHQCFCDMVMQPKATHQPGRQQNSEHAEFGNPTSTSLPYLSREITRVETSVAVASCVSRHSDIFFHECRIETECDCFGKKNKNRSKQKNRNNNGTTTCIQSFDLLFFTIFML